MPLSDGSGGVLEASGRRLRFGILIALALLVVLGLRLVFIQGVDASGHAQKAMDERLKSVTVKPERGSILDSQGRVLAASVARYDLVADQRLVKDYRVWDDESASMKDVELDDSLQKLSALLGMDVDELRERMVGDRPYKVVTKGVTPEIKEKAIDLGIPGLIAEPVSERSYPNGAVAGSILGFVGGDGSPLEGLELSQDDRLAGEAGKRTYEIAADGIRIPNAEFSETPAVDGDDVRLTIDQDVQWFAQEAIAEKTESYNADWGNITVMNAKTGEILAMADSTTVDPSDPSATDNLFWRPTSLTQSYEPGSTGKIATFATALEEGGISPTDGWTVPNHQDFDGQVVHDAEPHQTYDMTTAGIFTRSYNTGTVQVAESVDDQTRYDYLKKLGVGDPVDIGLPGSNKGILIDPAQWGSRQRLTTMFGQGYTQTTLHLAQILQTVANGGVKKSPQLIDAYISQDGAESVQPEDAGIRVFSEETSSEMLKMMEGVVQMGTAAPAKIPGYRVGGKTGTGEAAGIGGYDGYTTSFGGVAPLDDPQFVVAVSVHRPQGDWHSWQVEDTAAEVLSYLLTKYNVPPSDEKPQNYDVFTEDPQKRPW
ncbi:peptidoglycan D,D-transpeptidase FtsI family protein [Citricoccus sp. GCM10030269]|uniref:peptidoglycan D,D-transpeptidase FtsI family protein n=1 Tax=Citricoccus sp. GCM10030269 TaxID=3273388 RepID=UPI00361F5CE9